MVDVYSGLHAAVCAEILNGMVSCNCICCFRTQSQFHDYWNRTECGVVCCGVSVPVCVSSSPEQQWPYFSGGHQEFS